LSLSFIYFHINIRIVVITISILITILSEDSPVNYIINDTSGSLLYFILVSVILVGSSFPPTLSLSFEQMNEYYFSCCCCYYCLNCASSPSLSLSIYLSFLSSALVNSLIALSPLLFLCRCLLLLSLSLSSLLSILLYALIALTLASNGLSLSLSCRPLSLSLSSPC